MASAQHNNPTTLVGRERVGSTVVWTQGFTLTRGTILPKPHLQPENSTIFTLSNHSPICLFISCHFFSPQAFSPILIPAATLTFSQWIYHNYLHVFLSSSYLLEMNWWLLSKANISTWMRDPNPIAQPLPLFTSSSSLYKHLFLQLRKTTSGLVE
jgi:hypothetical protein